MFNFFLSFPADFFYCMETGYYKSIAGNISIIIENQQVTRVSFVHEIEDIQEKPSLLMETTVKQIREYFQGSRMQFDLPIRMNGTDFQVKIWKLLMRIPCGTTVAYVKVAQEFGDSKMVRAVASAIAKNPLLILIPCHRVIGSDRSMVGYSAGISIKRLLLEHEGYPK